MALEPRPFCIHGRQRGVDVDAVREERRWLIEAKGSGSLNAMRVNYFIS
jgi:hypothetical protein